MTPPTVPTADQRRDAETALQRAARAAAGQIHDQYVDAVTSGDGCPTVESMAAIIYQTIRNAREI